MRLRQGCGRIREGSHGRRRSLLAHGGRRRTVGAAIGEMLPLAIGIAISPLAIVAVILILTTPRARTNGPAFLGG